MTLTQSIDEYLVYRFWSESDALLYVGHTRRGASRFAQHAADKPWWPEVARITIQRCESLTAARVAEQAAIDAGVPTYNLVRASGKTPLHSFRCPDDLWEAAKVKAAQRDETVADVLRKALQRYVRSKR